MQSWMVRGMYSSSGVHEGDLDSTGDIKGKWKQGWKFKLGQGPMFLCWGCRPIPKLWQQGQRWRWGWKWGSDVCQSSNTESKVVGNWSPVLTMRVWKAMQWVHSLSSKAQADSLALVLQPEWEAILVCKSSMHTIENVFEVEGNVDQLKGILCKEMGWVTLAIMKTKLHWPGHRFVPKPGVAVRWYHWWMFIEMCSMLTCIEGSNGDNRRWSCSHVGVFRARTSGGAKKEAGEEERIWCGIKGMCTRCAVHGLTRLLPWYWLALLRAGASVSRAWGIGDIINLWQGWVFTRPKEEWRTMRSSCELPCPKSATWYWDRCRVALHIVTRKLLIHFSLPCLASSPQGVLHPPLASSAPLSSAFSSLTTCISDAGIMLRTHPFSGILSWVPWCSSNLSSCHGRKTVTFDQSFPLPFQVTFWQCFGLGADGAARCHLIILQIINAPPHALMFS